MLPARTTDKVVYLTFDDGPGAWTQPILDVLAEYDARATFFVLGVQAAEWPDMIKTIYEAGHGVANHTWKHVNLEGVSKSYFEDEIVDTADAIGEYESKCLRPPYGARNQTTYDYAKDLGYEIALWSIDTGDWRQPGAPTIATETLAQLHNRAVILMHDGGGDRSQTVASLRILLPELIARGYSMRAVCRDDPMPQVGDYVVGIPSELNLEVPTSEPEIAAVPVSVDATTGDELAFAGDSIAVPPAEAVSEADEVTTLAAGSAGAITFPVQGATVRGRIMVQGYVNAQSAGSTADSASAITSWRLNLLDIELPVVLATGEPTSRTGALGVWDTRAVDNGEHTLRLEITHADGAIEQRIVNVIVRN